MLITALLTCVVAANAPTSSDTIFQPQPADVTVHAHQARAGDVTPPTVTISSPAPNQRLPYGAILFRVIASDAGGLATVALLTDDGRRLVWPLTPGATSNDHTVNVANLGAGTHRITALAIDRDGNEGTDSLTFVVEPRAFNQTTAEVGFTYPEGSTLTVAPGTTVILRGWARDDRQVTSLKWSMTGATTGGGTLAGANTWSLRLPALNLGSHTVKMIASDGTRDGVSASVTVRVQNDTTPGPGPNPGDGNEHSGDIKTQKCGAGGGIATFLLLFGSLVGLRGRRRIE